MDGSQYRNSSTRKRQYDKGNVICLLKIVWEKEFVGSKLITEQKQKTIHWA